MRLLSLFKPSKATAFGDHIQTLSRMCEEKDETILKYLEYSKGLAELIGERNKLIEGLLGALDTATFGLTKKPEHDLFSIVFTIDDRIAIKRAIQLLETV